MASQGPNFPGTEADDAGVGTNAWSTGEAGACDGTGDESFLSGLGEVSHYLKLTNFGFSIPTGSTINGIEVVIERQNSNLQGVKDNRVRIVKGGTIGATDKSNANYWLDGSYETITYGSSSELWGETWTASDINDSTFGWVISAAGVAGAFPGGLAAVDCVKITVTYTVPTTTVAWLRA